MAQPLSIPEDEKGKRFSSRVRTAGYDALPARAARIFGPETETALAADCEDGRG